MAYMRQNPVGLGEYDNVGDWGWEFYPPPYDFLAPRDSKAMPAPVIYTPLPRSGPSGLGCGSCGGTCGGCSGKGIGLFESGLDFSQWGVGEWGTVAVIGYLTLSLVGDLMSAGRGVRKGYKKTRDIARRAGSAGRKKTTFQATI
jgi:hypothetical protein